MASKTTSRGSARQYFYPRIARYIAPPKLRITAIPTAITIQSPRPMKIPKRTMNRPNRVGIAQPAILITRCP